MAIFETLKRIFGYAHAAAATSLETAVPAAGVSPRQRRTAPDKPVILLSLLEILQKLPTDLQPLINRLPDADATIAMRVGKIMRQLPGGSVKMQLTSLRRQAPHGTFHKANIDWKRMVDLPLALVLKALDPSQLERHPAQMEYDLPASSVGVFSDNGRSRRVADPAVEATEALWMPGVSPERRSVMASDEPLHPGAPNPSNGTASESARFSPDGELSLSLLELATGWPPEVRSALSTVPSETKIWIPSALASRALKKERVTAAWSEIRDWIRPGISCPVSVPDDLELSFPLTIVAFAFLAATRAAKDQAGQAVEPDKQTCPDSTAHLMGEVAAPHPTPAPATANELKLSRHDIIYMTEQGSTAAVTKETVTSPAPESAPLKLAMPTGVPAVSGTKHPEDGAIDLNLPDFFGPRDRMAGSAEVSPLITAAAPTISMTPAPNSVAPQTSAPEGGLKCSVPCKIVAMAGPSAPASLTAPARVPPARDEPRFLRRKDGRSAPRTGGGNATASAVAMEHRKATPARDEPFPARQRSFRPAQQIAEKVNAAPGVSAEPAEPPPPRDETILWRRRTGRSGPKNS